MRIEKILPGQKRFSQEPPRTFIKEDEFDTLVREMVLFAGGYATAFTDPGVRSRLLWLVDKKTRGKGSADSLMHDLEFRAKKGTNFDHALEVRVTKSAGGRTSISPRATESRERSPDYYGKGEDAFFMEKNL